MRIYTAYMRAYPLHLCPSTVSFSRCNLHLTPPYTRSLSRSPLPLCANGNKVARFKLYASFGAQVAALSQIMANKLFDEIARDSRTTIVSRRSLAVRCTAPRAVSDRAEGCFCHTALDFFLTLLSFPPFLLFSIFWLCICLLCVIANCSNCAN